MRSKYQDSCKAFDFGCSHIYGEPESFTSYSKTVMCEFWLFNAKIDEIISGY